MSNQPPTGYQIASCPASALRIGEWFSLVYPPSPHFPVFRVIRRSKRGNIVANLNGSPDYEQPFSTHRRVHRQLPPTTT